MLEDEKAVESPTENRACRRRGRSLRHGEASPMMDKGK
jgi:hypothetical protein